MLPEFPIIELPKARGEWAELRFMTRAAEHGLAVCKPWGESKHYDFIAEYDRCLTRIQVKSTMHRQNKGRAYSCCLRGGIAYYTKNDFDFIAIYIIPLDLWYIIPSPVAITGRQHIYLSPQYPKSIYEPYREAWFQLKQKRCISHANADLCFRHGCTARIEKETIEKEETVFVQT